MLRDSSASIEENLKELVEKVTFQSKVETQSYLNVEARRRRLADGCRHVYLDVGSNIGVQIRKLFEPKKYPKALQTIRLFERLFGPENVRRHEVCAFGFEANPAHNERLSYLQNCYSNLSWKTKIFYGTGVSNADGEILRFYKDPRYAKESAFSMVDWSGHSEMFVDVKTIDLARFINEEIRDRVIPSPSSKDSRPPKTLMKLDIEGSEYRVMSHMLLNGVFCHLDEAFIEYHHNSPWVKLPPDMQVDAEKFVDIFDKIRTFDSKFLGCNFTVFHQVDDESHKWDGKEFPDECL